MKNKIARRLTHYFVLTLLLFALVVGVLFSLMFARHTADVTRRDMHAHASAIADTFEQFIGESKDGDCKGTGFKAYMRFIGDAAMGDLHLLDEAGNHVILGEMEPPESPLNQAAQPLVRHVFETGETTSIGFSPVSFLVDDMIVCAPVHDAQGGVQLALVLRANVSSIGHALEDAFYMLTACLGIALVIAVAASFFLSRRFVDPLHRMMDTTTQMANGNYHVKTRVVQQDEIGVLAAHIDMLAQKLDEAEKEYSRFEQMRQEFFSNISHELRTPISVLSGSIEMLREGMIEDPQRRKQYMDQLYTDVRYLQRLVNDMLELTRLQNTQFRIEMDVVNLMDVIADTVRFMRQKADEKGVRICQEEGAPFAVLGDYARLRQMMIILLDNAIKFSDAGGEVQIACRRTGNVCAVSVADRGCGIEEEALSHIFDRYFHNRSGANRGGTGLGLPIAREIAARHNVEISCQSRPGEGTCFTLTFIECGMSGE